MPIDNVIVWSTFGNGIGALISQDWVTLFQLNLISDTFGSDNYKMALTNQPHLLMASSFGLFLDLDNSRFSGSFSPRIDSR